MIYILQVRSGKEESVCRRLNALNIETFTPMKKMFIRRRGQWHEEIRLIFPQYVFVQSPVCDTGTFSAVWYTDGFIRFLGDGRPQSVSSKEEAWLLWLKNNGEPLSVSRVSDNQNGENLILDGALKNCPETEYEIEYHLRQRRAVIHVNLMGRKHKITLPVMPA